MAKKFVPKTYKEEQYSRLHTLHQGKNSVQSYARDFEELLIKCNLQENEHQTMVRFLEGLNDEIKFVVELQPYKTLHDLILLAHKVEKQQKQKGKGKGTSNSFEQNQPTLSQTKPYSTPHIENKEHDKNESKRPYVKPKGPPKCFKCQGYGHMAYDCPNAKVVSLVECEGRCEEEKEGETEIEEIELGPDEGHCLMLQSVFPLNDLEQDNDPIDFTLQTKSKEEPIEHIEPIQSPRVKHFDTLVMPLFVTPFCTKNLQEFDKKCLIEHYESLPFVKPWVKDDFQHFPFDDPSKLTYKVPYFATGCVVISFGRSVEGVCNKKGCYWGSFVAVFTWFLEYSIEDAREWVFDPGIKA